MLPFELLSLLVLIIVLNQRQEFLLRFIYGQLWERLHNFIYQ
ncbi:hypothetical protein CWATWH0402_620 [Crocosphaera watsonii WH 0402]|uniref:Uncharacterized protein n=4 Tax=Crocosphaera watsonii TaxID=263511 RepID=T2JWS7_CROWT|nr:hypothetical protein CWATWH0003_3048 [Crocosphaera watsonii WH 0003]CCQ53921.1 hypothetical protein CWATWH0005_3285 [Crocosphaera watsonii WH 0005]CCQ59775.1 hypothetical protein CWATWH0401_649 [Crocosphaera watsonii WH 0401]CCQ69665.1 hypothetical protein CWATWH0402_620 [Crocosphaera watsonii WH 0402]